MDIILLLLLQFYNELMIGAAQQFSFLTYLIVIAIGATQGFVTGQAIVERFPRLQYHARFASIFLFSLFAMYAIVSVIRFVEPEKVRMDELLASTPEGLVSVVMKVMGLHPDIGTVIAFSISLFMLVILKLTKLKGYSKWFVLTISIVMLIIMITSKFSDYNPGSFEILLFILYNASITGGFVWGTRMKLYSRELRARNFINLWTGKSQ